MMNPTYHFAKMRALLDEYEPGRERSLAATKIDEAELWLTRCVPTAEAAGRDMRPFTDDEVRLTPAGEARADELADGACLECGLVHKYQGDDL